MCLVSIAFRVHPDYPLILAGNRDEYHARPSAPADWWDDRPDLLGGRDLQAGGTWLAVNNCAHLAVVTNRPDLPPPDEGALSRGDLVVGALTPNEFSFTELAETHHQYGGFSLLAANREALTLFSGGNGTSFERRDLQPGIYGISNTAIDDPWPKVGWLDNGMAEVAGQPEPDADAVLAMLTRTDPVPDAASHGVPATPFVWGDVYGTRCCTVAMIRTDGSGTFIERRFGPGGTPLGESRYELAFAAD